MKDEKTPTDCEVRLSDWLGGVTALRVLVACEESGRVRDAFAKLGHDATSCDLFDTENAGKHYKGDVFDIINDEWDLMIAHPPCTRLTVTGNKWYKPEYRERFPNIEIEREESVEFFMKLANAPINKIAIENPIGIMSSRWRKPEQIIQPYYFGDEERKATCLWLKNLPKLKPTNIVEPKLYTYADGRTDGMWHVETMKLPKAERSKQRSKTFYGIANAMAEQWGGKVTK